MGAIAPRRGLGVPELDPDEDEVDRPEARRVVGRPHGIEVDVAELAADHQPPLAHRREVGAAGDEGDLAAALGEPRAEVAADPARAHHRDAHQPALTFLSIGPSGAPANRWTWRCGTSWCASAPWLASIR